MRGFNFVDFCLHQTGLLRNTRQHGFFIKPLLVGGKQRIEQIADRLNRAGHFIRRFAQKRKHGLLYRAFVRGGQGSICLKI